MKFIVNGTFASYAEKILSAKKYYADYKSAAITQAEFCAAMLADESLAGVAGFHDIPRIAKTPANEKMPSEKIFGYLAANNLISAQDYNTMYDGFDKYRENIYKNYNHGEFITYVYPEDERLLYAAAKIARPKQLFMAGSYYGYLAVWAMQAVHDTGGTAVFSDIDEEVCSLAKANFNNLGFRDCADICCESTSVLLAKRTEPIDMLILDATGKSDDPRPEYRGKRIYGAFLHEAKHLLHKGAVIYIHNMEPENPEMRPLVDGLREINAHGENYDTFNGLGVYTVI